MMYTFRGRAKEAFPSYSHHKREDKEITRVLCKANVHNNDRRVSSERDPSCLASDSPSI